MKTTINQNHLKSVARAMATKDIRHYLNGVLVEYNGADLRLVATDGHRLHGVRVELGGLVVEPVSFIIPAAMVQRIIKAKAPRGSSRATVALYFDPETKRIEAALPDGSSILDTAIDGVFPDYRRLFDFDVGEPALAHYNPQYLLDLELSMLDYLGLSKTEASGHAITQRGEGLGVVSFDGFFAGVMPIRSSNYETTKYTRDIATNMQKPE